MDKKFYQEYYTLEREGWWFKARLSILESYCKDLAVNTNIKILNVGAATGATSEMLSRYGEVTSLEYDKFCCEFLKVKTGIEAINASLTELPFKNNTYDLICAFDVIEHIEDHEKALDEIYRVLRPHGKYFLTVPAFQSLWSNHDVVNHHYRRYTKKKFGKGKRIFLMAPLHHHYEKKGWKETQVVVRFWIITMMLVLIGLASLKIR